MNSNNLNTKLSYDDYVVVITGFVMNLTNDGQYYEDVYACVVNNEWWIKGVFTTGYIEQISYMAIPRGYFSKNNIIYTGSL